VPFLLLHQRASVGSIDAPEGIKAVARNWVPKRVDACSPSSADEEITRLGCTHSSLLPVLILFHPLFPVSLFHSYALVPWVKQADAVAGRNRTNSATAAIAASTAANFAESRRTEAEYTERAGNPYIFIYLSIYICIYEYVCMYIYIYIYIYTDI
jgi:hypothetical protein